MSLDTIRLSEQAKDQLARVKRNTRIKNWNVLCRWALCISLTEEAMPNQTKIPADSSVEMTWKVFGGIDSDVYMALVKQRCHEDGLETDPVTVEEQFRLHLHRGIGYLFGDPELKSLGGLVKRAN
jgi:DNA sulfur modification protein DndE